MNAFGGMLNKGHRLSTLIGSESEQGARHMMEIPDGTAPVNTGSLQGLVDVGLTRMNLFPFISGVCFFVTRAGLRKRKSYSLWGLEGPNDRLYNTHSTRNVLTAVGCLSLPVEQHLGYIACFAKCI